MKITTEYEPQITNYMVPTNVERIDFYGQMGVGLPPRTTAKELYVIEFLDDPSHARFLSFARPHTMSHNWSETLTENLYEHLKDSGEYAEWLRRGPGRDVPAEVSIKEEKLRSIDAVKVSAKWWEVTL